ncbi:MAG: tetratricopeptide repeat protein [Bryobacteraceae bacterium]|nr:tetratricopeptide repeat protein [Bryobacteraceae bacterium]
MIGRTELLLLVIALLVALLSCGGDPETAKRQLLATGNKYFDAGKFKEASILYRKTIQKDRRYGEAYYRLALAELQLGRVAEAVAALERATELEPSNEDAFARLADLYLAIYAANPSSAGVVIDKTEQLIARAEQTLPESFHLRRVKGFVALTRKDYSSAIQSFRQANRIQPDDGSVALGLAESLTAGGRFGDAEKLAKAFIARQKSYTGMYDFLWLRYFRGKRIEEAGKILESKCSNNPSLNLCQLQLALHYHLAGDRARRGEAIDRLLTAFPEAATYESVGDFYRRVGEYGEALKSYEKGAEIAAKKTPDFQKKIVETLAIQGKTDEAFRRVGDVLADSPADSQALAMRGALRLRSGNRDELQAAQSDLEAALRALPENPTLRFNLGEAYLLQGNRERAVVEYEEALKRSPNYLPPRYGLARAYMENRDYAKVVAVAEEILSRRPDDVNAKMLRANAWLFLGKRDLAKAGFEEVLQQAPDAPEALYRVAAIELAEKDYDRAEARFRSMAERRPSDPRATLGLAELEIARRRPNNAVRLIQAKIDQNPKDPFWRRVMGSIAARAGNPERALRELKLTLEEQPDDVLAHQQLAHVYMQQRNYEEAANHLRRVIKQRPNDPASNLSLALVLENQGQRLRAIPYYEKTLAASPDDAVALNNLAFLLAEATDDLDRALALAQRARSRAPNEPDFTDTLAWVYVKKNLNESAIALLTDLVSKHPDRASWRYHLGVAYYQNGDSQRARRELEAALRGKPTREEESQIRELLEKIKG